MKLSRVNPDECLDVHLDEKSKDVELRQPAGGARPVACLGANSPGTVMGISLKSQSFKSIGHSVYILQCYQ